MHEYDLITAIRKHRKHSSIMVSLTDHKASDPWSSLIVL